MAYKRLMLGLVVSLIGSTFVGPVRADSVDKFRAEARKYERDGEWYYACQRYHYLWKTHGEASDRRAYLTCLRNMRRLHRHDDSSYQELTKRELSVAVEVYKDSLKALRDGYVDEDLVQLQLLLGEGMKEFRASLRDSAFCARYVSEEGRENVSRFLVNDLPKYEIDWAESRPKNPDQVVTKVTQFALDVNKALGVPATVTVLDFACGACNALDEHTYYLPPIQYQKEVESLRGERVGIGADVDDQLIVRHVMLGGPAATVGIKEGDRLLAIDGKELKRVSSGEVQMALSGLMGSRVELKLIQQDADGNERERKVTITRAFPSVTNVKMLDPDTGVGYIRLVRFDDKTPLELDAAIKSLEAEGMKSMVLDLRGNSGGCFESSVKVASAFLPRGECIVQATKGGKLVKEYTSNNKRPNEVPLVLVTDQGTASAAEVVAAALENRASVVGSKTFGKGTRQGIRKLQEQDAGGVRITMHNLLSPHGQAIQGAGVLPKHAARPEAAESVALDIARSKARDRD